MESAPATADMEEDPGSVHSILVLCAHNAVRSPMCAALLRERFGRTKYVVSAGLEPDEAVNGFAVQVMNDAGLDISGHAPQDVDALEDESFDLIIALSPEAFKKAREMAAHGAGSAEFWDLPEPPGVLEGLPHSQMLEAYKRLLKEIRAHIGNRFAD